MKDRPGVPKISALARTFEIHGLTLGNRVVMSPMTRGRAGEKGIPNALMAEYYGQRTSAGLIITEGTFVSKQAIGWLNAPGIYSDEQSEAWKGVVDAVHANGTPIFLQLWHCGRASHSSFHEEGRPPVAPSAIRLNGDILTAEGKRPFDTPRALETDEIPMIVEDFRRAAERAMSAGFDGVEIHAANGYLIDEFLQSKTNHRSGLYGGSLEKRYRFLDEIVKSVVEVCPYRTGVHLSPNGSFNDMGSPDYRETFLYAAEKLDPYPLAYLHVLDGLAFGFHGLGEPVTLAEFRKVFGGPLMGNGGYTRERAETAIQEGHADMISFGRPYISNPDLAERFLNDWPLNPPADQKIWYSSGPEGYIDFPRYENSGRTGRAG